MGRFPRGAKPEKECATSGYGQGEGGKNKDAEILFIHKRSPEKGYLKDEDNEAEKESQGSLITN